jgi:tetratricopeptide (TPR) repeat protein
MVLSGSIYSLPQEQAYVRKAERHFDRAGWLETNGDPGAEQEYKLAIAARGGRYPEAWQGLERVYAAQLRFSEASAALQNYMVLTPKRSHAGDVEELQRLQQAAELQIRISVSEPPSLEDLLQFIPNVMAYGGLAKATTYGEMAVRLYPNSSMAHLTLARYLPSNDPDQRKKQLTLIEKAIELDPDSSAAHSQLGWYYFSIGGHVEESAREYRKALELSSEQNVDAWYGFAQVLSTKGQNKDAIEAYRNYLRLRKVPSQNDNYVRREIERLQKSN